MKRTVFTLISLAILLASCTRDEMSDDGSDKTKAPVEKRNLPLLVPGAVQEGTLYIKVEPQAASVFEAASTASADGGAILTGISTMDAALNELGAYRFERVFRHGGKYEQRHRKAGLHLWYKVVFDENIDVMTAANRLVEIDDVTFIEGAAFIELIGGDQEPVIFTEQQLAAMQNAEPSAVLSIYNDPMLGNQWHYQNDGSKRGFLAGSDINLFRAWEIESGKPEVIVSIVDGGVDYNHPDLKQNMWINEAELNDDDNNGYVDDIYGYNFVMKNGSIIAHDHGTHVGGTVAAVNNNGVGVSGVAGGDGSPESGVRLMSCQVFQSSGGWSQSADDFGAAIIYGADNGAVISQNSWGYTRLGELEERIKDAIDYFIEYAGTDETGEVQVGPMKGGIVIFAAGNEDHNGLWMPGAYEKCFAVASMGPTYKKASYSCYGTWIEATAPGGEYYYHFGGNGEEGYVFSTYPGNQYGGNLGTSMACPHVSGIAALAVSKYGVGTPGYTPDKLRARLLASTNEIYGYNPSYTGQLGNGYIDTFKVLADSGGQAPQPVDNLDVIWTFEGAYLKWSVTSDPDSGKADRYDILCSESDLRGVDFDNPPAGTWKTIARVNDLAVGDKMSARVKGMTVGRTYYISIAAVDSDGNRSSAYTTNGTTEPNRPPMVSDPGHLTFDSAEYREVPVEVIDAEGYKWTYTLSAGSGALSVRKESDEKLIFTFDCIKALPGSYTAKLTVQDEQGLSADVDIPYTIKVNQAPRVAVEGPREFVISGINQTRTFPLSGLFTDDDVLSYEVKLADPSFADVSNSEGILTVTTRGVGTSQLTVTAKDPRGLSATTTVTIVCRNAERTMDLYPVPVKKDGVLNIRMGDDVDGTIEVTLFKNSSGVKVFDKTADISPGAPVTVNIGSLPTGTYKVTVKYENTETSKIITKL